MISIPPDLNFGGILPAILLCLAGMIVMVLGLFINRGKVTSAALISLIGVLVAIGANTPLRWMNKTAFAGLISLDAYTWFFNLLVLIATGITVLVSIRYFNDDGSDLYEFFALLLFSAAGMMFMVSANHILVIFIGLETLSISIYVLAGILPGNVKAKEASLKYLILGGFSSAIFPLRRCIDVRRGRIFEPACSEPSIFNQDLSARWQPSVSACCWWDSGLKWRQFRFTCGLPDVYEGAPTPLTGFMSVV